MDNDIATLTEALAHIPEDGVELIARAALFRIAIRLRPVDLAEFEGHTEGDWKIEPDDEFQKYPFIPIVSGVILVCEVASLLDADGKIFNITKQSRATARLIAAAPRLLRELTEARARIAVLEAKLRQLLTTPNYEDARDDPLVLALGVEITRQVRESRNPAAVRWDDEGNIKLHFECALLAKATRAALAGTEPTQ